jgi:dolichyldiphosphatase
MIFPLKMRQDDCSHLQPFGLSYVQYMRHDTVGMVLAAASLIPFVVLVAYVAALYATRDVRLLSALVGQVLNEAFNFVLKNIIREPRPVGCLGSGKGMPSSHAQFMGFVTAYCILTLYKVTNVHALACTTYWG